jgi:fibronectin type 3 domain-containing protein
MAAGQTISYYVIARDNSGGSFTSSTVDVFIPFDVCQPAPAAPSLVGSAACDTTGPRAIVNLTWSGSPTAASYVISRTPSSSPFPVTTTGTAYTDTTVNPGGSYTYKVTAINSGGSTDSNPKTTNVSESICPPGPLTATATAFCAAGPPVAPAVHVTWTASAFATSYVVKRDGTPVSGTLSSSTSSFDDFNGVTANQTYNYTVIASNATADTASPPSPVTITGLPCTPPPPGSFAASVGQLCSLGAPDAHVTWSASSGASSYVVNRNGSPISGSLSSGTTSFDDANVTPGQTYTYTVTATSGGGSTTSASSTLTIASCGNNTPPPTAFEAGVNAFCNAGSPAVHVFWTVGNNATSWVVNRNGSAISGAITTDSGYNDTTVTAGQTYTYSVVASNSGGSTTAQAGSITPSANVCPPPAFTLTAAATCNQIVSPPLTMVTLNWSGAATATSYLIIRDGTQIGAVDSTTNTFNDSGATSPQTYSYVVRAVGPGGTTASNTATATVQANMCSTPRPDLAATDITFAVPAGNFGDPLAVGFTVTNVSTSAAAPATTSHVRIGSGLTMSPSDPVVAAVATPPLAAGASTRQTTTITIPNLPAGTYYFFLSVDEDHVSGDINPSNDIKRSPAFMLQRPACVLGCAATVPATAQAATPVAFRLQQQPACLTVRADWTFGDSATSTQSAPSHTYTATGTYHWTLTLTAASGETCSSSGNITITAPAVPPKRRAVHH